MISKLTRLLIGALILSLAIAIIYLNRGDVTVSYGPEKSFTAMGGVVYLVWFALGIAVSLFFWVVYGIKAYFRERALLSKGEQSKLFYQSMLEARSLQASKEQAQAQDKWKKLIKKDPTDIIARIELSRSLEEEGDIKQALKVLDKARTAAPTNPEVLLRASELNIALGNKTAAIDNLALILYHHPNLYAAELARDLSEQLGRVEDALEYNRQFETLGGERSDQVTMRLHYQQLLDQLKEEDEKTRISKIKKFVANNKGFIPAARDLAILYTNGNQIDEAANVLLKASKDANDSPETTSTALWRQAIELWLSQGSEEKALSTAKTAVRNASSDREKLDATLDNARLELLMKNPEGALNLLNDQTENLIDTAFDFESSKKSSSRCPGISGRYAQRRLRQDFNLLKGLALNKLERHAEAGELWEKLASERKTFSNQFRFEESLDGESGKNGANKNGILGQPSPELSTP